MTIKQVLASVFLLFIAFFISGCADNDQVNNEENVDEQENLVEREPVTLTMAADHYNDELFDEMFKEPIENTHSHITLEKVNLDHAWSIEEIEEMIVADELPDIILRPTGDIHMAKDTGIFTDLQPYIEKYDFDLSVLKPELLDVITGLGESMKDVTIPVLPVNLDNSGIIYNKDIFDRLGIEYPQDGMTWDEMIALAEELTQEVDGMQYRGLVTMPPQFMATQLSVGYVDPETEEPLVDDEGWKEIFEVLERIHTIPGNEDALGWPNIFGDQDIAMMVRVNLYEQVTPFSEDEINIDWDIAQYPSFPDKPNVGYGAAAHNVFVSSMSDYPDDAFLAITAILSDEAQQVASEYMKDIVVNSEDLEANFGKEFPIFDGKNTDAILKTSSAPLPTETFTVYDPEARTIIDQVFEEQILEENLDVNSALRRAYEEIDQLIQETKSGQ